MECQLTRIPSVGNRTIGNIDVTAVNVKNNSLVTIYLIVIVIVFIIYGTLIQQTMNAKTKIVPTLNWSNLMQMKERLIDNKRKNYVTHT